MSGQEFHTTDVLRLEVQQTPTGLYNLVQNPSGELGGWGWITPISGSSMQGGNNLHLVHGSGTYDLIYNSVASTANNFHSELAPVTAGQYVGARWNFVDGISGSTWIRVQLNWYDSARALLSSSTISSYFGEGTNNYSATVAPASTAYVALNIHVYSNNSGANPTGGHIHINEVTMAKAATSGEIGAVRTNLVKNPAFETNITGWENRSNTSVAWASSGGASPGSGCLEATLASTADAEVQQSATGTSAIPITGGETYGFGMKVWVNNSSRFLRIGIGFWDASGAGIYGAYSPSFSAVSGAWNSLWTYHSAPSNAAYARLFVKLEGGSTSEVFKVDQAMLERTSSEDGYFDGSFTDAGGISYDWTGTAHASTSTASQGFLAYLEPIQWQNVLGPSHEIKVDREGLNPGGLSATILDANLDPASSDLIRPGKQCRLVVQDGNELLPIFTGRVTKGSTKYDLTSFPGETRVRIELEAVDNISVLAQHKRVYGVADIDELRWTLEGAGVPWNINGASGQWAGSDPDIESANENATALDQISITRDSNMGLAWVDRRNVINVIDNPGSGLVAADDFTGADSTTSIWDGPSGPSGRSTPTGGFAWTGSAQASDWGISTNRCTCTGDGSLVVDLGETEVTMEVDYTVAASADDSGLYLRMVNEDNVIRVRATSTGWQIQQVVGAAVVYNGTRAGTVTGSTTYNLRVICAGSTVQVYVDDALTLSAPIESALASATKYGFKSLGSGHYWDNFSISEDLTVATLDDDDLTDIEVDYDTARSINTVTARRIAYDDINDESIELVETFVDQGLVDEWGPFAAEFTIGGSVNFEDFAEAVIAANGVPQVRILSATLPIVTETDTTTKALIDLCDLVAVSNDVSGLDEDLRVASITHEIEPTKWLMTLGFDSPTGVAQPQVYPPLNWNP